MTLLSISYEAYFGSNPAYLDLLNNDRQHKERQSLSSFETKPTSAAFILKLFWPRVLTSSKSLSFNYFDPPLLSVSSSHQQKNLSPFYLSHLRLFPQDVSLVITPNPINRAGVSYTFCYVTIVAYPATFTPTTYYILYLHLTGSYCEVAILNQPGLC